MKRYITGILAVMLIVCGCLTGCAGRGQSADKEESGFRSEYEESAFTQEDVDSDTVQWFCSAYAIYTQLNKKDLGMIGGTSPENKEMNERAIKEALKSGWEITDHASAVSVINKVFSEGQRKNYQKLLKEMEEYGLLSQTEEQVENEAALKGSNVEEYIAVYRAYHDLGETAVDGWDYCRILQVLGDCYQAGYISLEECLDVSLTAAKKLQGTYAGWEDLCKSYLYGYYLWSHDGVDTKWRWGIYEELNGMQDGPYTVPYGTKLKESWKNVKKSAPKDPDGQEGTETDAQDTDSGSDLKADANGRYSLKSPDGSKEVYVSVPENYEIDMERSEEDFLVFASTSEEGVSYVSLMYSLDLLNEYYTEDDIAALIKNNVDRWKEDSMYPYLEYTDVQELKAGDHTVKYNSVVTSFSDKGTSYDRQWNAWYTTEDGYAVVCGGVETAHDEKIQTERIEKAMSLVSE